MTVTVRASAHRDIQKIPLYWIKISYLPLIKEPIYVNGPGRSGDQSLGQGPVFGRPSNRPLFPTVKNPTIGGRSGGRPTAGFPAELDPNGYIFKAYKLGLFWAVLYKISSGFSS